jgi:hypothetical protein
MRGLVLCLVLAAWPLHVMAAAASDFFSPARATSPFSLDPSLSDPRWASAKKIADFTDVLARRPAASQTSVAMFYDDDNIYIGFWCEQSQPITADQRTNNVGFGSDDYVGFGVDTGGNADRVYQFEITPAGTRFQQATENTRYRPHWQGAARVTQGQWTAMMIVPLHVLHLSAGKTQTWRLNFMRFVAQGTERQTWGYSGNMDASASFPNLADARYWPSVHGVQFTHKQSKPPPSFNFYALTSSGEERDVFVTPAGTTFTRNPRAAGVDIIYPMTPTVSFVGALNPDFSNVDVDQLTITPQVYPRNLTEYRPFFAEGANFINNDITQLGFNENPYQTFYSPSIGTFDRGFKVEGTLGKYQSLGLLEARGSNDQSGEAFDDVAFGYKHVLPSRTFGYWTNGVIANHGGLHDNVFELGMQARDLRTGWVGAIFHGRDMGTNVTDASRGIATYGFIDHQNANHEALIGFRDIGPLYNPVDGYTPISDIHGLGAAYNLFGSGPAHSPVHDGSVNFFADRFFDDSGAIHKADAGFTANANLRNDFSLALSSIQSEVRSYGGNIQTGYPFYQDGITQPYDQTYIGIGYKQNSPSPTYAQYSWGPFSNYYLQQFNSTATRQLGRRFTLSLEYDGTIEKFFVGSLDGQWLRKVTFGWSIDSDTTFSLALRSISGTGGFATPGLNFSAGIHRVYDSGNELYISFGTPGANQTINRFTVKYAFKAGHRND